MKADIGFGDTAKSEKIESDAFQCRWELDRGMYFVVRESAWAWYLGLMVVSVMSLLIVGGLAAVGGLFPLLMVLIAWGVFIYIGFDEMSRKLFEVNFDRQEYRLDVRARQSGQKIHPDMDFSNISGLVRLKKRLRLIRPAVQYAVMARTTWVGDDVVVPLTGRIDLGSEQGRDEAAAFESLVWPKLAEMISACDKAAGPAELTDPVCSALTARDRRLAAHSLKELETFRPVSEKVWRARVDGQPQFILLGGLALGGVLVIPLILTELFLIWFLIGITVVLMAAINLTWATGIVLDGRNRCLTVEMFWGFWTRKIPFNRLLGFQHQQRRGRSMPAAIILANGFRLPRLSMTYVEQDDLIREARLLLAAIIDARSEVLEALTYKSESP